MLPLAKMLSKFNLLIIFFKRIVLKREKASKTTQQNRGLKTITIAAP
jgi:hypothetical protein